MIFIAINCCRRIFEENIRAMDVIEKEKNWYKDAKKYWDSLEPTDNSMLGGLENLSELDAAASGRFLSEFINNGMIKKQAYACDCGAGIGRVTRTFLLKFFEKVDMIEQTEKFLDQAERDFERMGLKSRVNFVPLGIQDFTPFPNKYDLIWAQWVLSHLTDADLVSFLKRCIAAAPFIGIKENYTEFKTVYDDDDSSKTRSESEWKSLFEEAGLIIIRETKQIAFPLDLFPVKMFLLADRSIFKK